jgi:hypothetical protein
MAKLSITLGGKAWEINEPTVWDLYEIEDTKVEAAEAQIKLDKLAASSGIDISIETPEQRNIRLSTSRDGSRIALKWHVALVNAALNSGKGGDETKLDASKIPFATPSEFAIAAYDILVYIGQIKPGEAKAQS